MSRFYLPLTNQYFLWYNIDGQRKYFPFPRFPLILSRKEVKKMPMDEKRKGEIALAAKKVDIRKEMAFRDIANLKRNIGNSVKEPEMVTINAKPEELLELAKDLVEEVFGEQIKAIS